MNRKIIFIILGVVVVLVLGYSFLWMKSGFIDYRPQTNEIANTQDYYDKLVSECKSKQSESCCMASVEAMKQGNYILATQEGCPAGYQPNMMRCIDSYRWCQPENTLSTTKPIVGVGESYTTDGTESGGYSGTAFCSVVNNSRFEIKDHAIVIDGAGPYQIKINEMKNMFSPYEYSNVRLVMHLRFDNKDNSYADTLYLGNDNNLYNCHGGK